MEHKTSSGTFNEQPIENHKSEIDTIIDKHNSNHDTPNTKNNEFVVKNGVNGNEPQYTYNNLDNCNIHSDTDKNAERHFDFDKRVKYKQSQELIVEVESIQSIKHEEHIESNSLEIKAPIDVRVTGIKRGRIYVQFTCLNPNETKALSGGISKSPFGYKCLLYKKTSGHDAKDFEEHALIMIDGCYYTLTPNSLELGVTYCVRVKTVLKYKESGWSDEAEFCPTEFSECCAWKDCPEHVGYLKRYSLDELNPRVATKMGDDDDESCDCTIVGNTPIPLNKASSWCIEILESRSDDCEGIFVGVAPSDINQNINGNFNKCGWYLDCFFSRLNSGPPHNYKWPGREYGPRVWEGGYVNTGDVVSVAIDTIKGELSFTISGVNYGVAYEGIPLDKPLVPCVILRNECDSVKLCSPEDGENVRKKARVMQVE